MIEKYLEKNYSIKNNKIVNKRFVEEIDFINLVFYIIKIFSISESDGFNYVFNFTIKNGYDLNHDYAYIDDIFIKIKKINLTTEVEEVNIGYFSRPSFGPLTTIMGKTKTHIIFDVTDVNGINYFIDKHNALFHSMDAKSPRYNMIHKGFCYFDVSIKSIDANIDKLTVNADVGSFKNIFKV
jgi:hypothetical protein